MTIRLASDGPQPLHADTIGAAWLAVAGRIIARHAEPGRLAWMHANFTDHAKVAALGGADSYATRLFDHEHSGRDQVAWP